MINDTFWDLLFGQIARMISWAQSTSAVSFTYEGKTYSLTWFALWVSFIIVTLIADIILWFNKRGKVDKDD